MTVMRDKRFVLVVVLIALLAAEFWAGSRYPALNEKMLMGANTPLAGLAFDPLIVIHPDAPVVTRIAYTAVNWMYTNRQGMTFGILLGALLMTLLRLIDQRGVRGRFGNTVLGVLIGTPLGVCANCAAPIGRAIHAAGGRPETMLATMVSSPTLNVVVLTMLFAFFPIYVGMIKVGLTVGFILICIPLLTRLLRTPNSAVVAAGPSPSVSTWNDRPMQPSTFVPGDPAATWSKALRWVARSFVADLWFIIKTTLPLMLLAGLLGSVLIVLVPLESLIDLLPSEGRTEMFLAMVGVALFGVFLPVPMSFDVIVTAILWQAGLPIKYALVLLFTLGIFSVFPFFIIWRAIGLRIAASLFLGLAGLGVVAGILGHQYYKWDYQRKYQLFLEVFRQSSSSLRGPKVTRFGGARREEMPDAELVLSLERTAQIPQPMQIASSDGISVARVPFLEPHGQIGGSTGTEKLFSRFDGISFGLDEPYKFSVLSLEPPTGSFRGIASGDVHNDGWVDLLLTSESGLSLYANLAGKGFALQRIDIPELKDFHIVNAALVDLNNDGWLDIFFSTFKHGNFVIYNTAGRFVKENLHHLPGQREGVMTGAAAFGDLYGNGKLDIVLGSWALPYFHGGDAHEPNTIVLRNDMGRFSARPLDVIPGQIVSKQTLSILISDINNDGKPDIIIGSEDRAPDYYYFGDGKGNFRQITRDSGIIPHSAATTMSIASADINNDLLPEIYVGQINSYPKGGRKSRQVGPELCDEIRTPEQRTSCQEILTVHKGMPKQVKTKDVFNCLSSVAANYQEDCIAYSLLLWARSNGPEEMCDLFPDSWEAFRFICHHGYGNRIGSAAEPSRTNGMSGSPKADGGQAIPDVFDKNVLLVPGGDGRFSDKAAEMGVQVAGFTWNAKFADVDNDEFVDLYAVNGWFPAVERESNVFFHNEQGKRFVDRTEQVGLTSFLSTSSYTYVDLDNDGDLDIVSVPIAGPVLVYINNSKKNRIAFELRDHVGNRFGIGSKIIIHYGPDGKRHQMREIQASGGFISFDAPIAYFGLSDFQRVERVEVHWSTGERSEIRGDFGAGARYIVSRQNVGATLPRRHP